jgi:prevent-host-death family protein
MSSKRDVKPITYLKSKTAELVLEVAETGRPITITQNGIAKVVVMDVATYDRWRAALTILKLAAHAETDVGNGRTASSDEAFRRAARAVDRVKRNA